jgi:uncharacterized protein YecE (DUF72 family)
MEPLIGTSGYSYREWKDDAFYPKGMKPAEQLAFFASKFDTVEINMTFYRPVAASTIERWVAVTPEDFAFTMKASKVITHFRRLKNVDGEIRSMWEQFGPLGKKLRCVLFQLPPSMKLDPPTLEKFLDKVEKERTKRGIESLVAVEFRNRSWYEPAVFTILEDRGMTAVLHDMPYKGGFWPIWQDDEWLLKSGHLIMHPDDWIFRTKEHFFYLRFHGTVQKKAWQEYGAAALEPWGDIARRCLEKNKPLFAYFNNDGHAAAVRDAAIFRELLGED